MFHTLRKIYKDLTALPAVLNLYLLSKSKQFVNKGNPESLCLGFLLRSLFPYPILVEI